MPTILATIYSYIGMISPLVMNGKNFEKRQNFGNKNFEKWPFLLFHFPKQRNTFGSGNFPDKFSINETLLIRATSLTADYFFLFFHFTKI